MNKLIYEYTFFLENPIKYIFTQKMMIYSKELNKENKFKTLKDFHIENGEIINILLEETDKNKIIKDELIKEIYKEEEKKEKEENEKVNSIIEGKNEIKPNISITPNNFINCNYVPFLKFVNCASSNNDRPFFINIILTEKFADVFNRLKELNSDLNNYDFEEILLSGKKYKPQDINDKTIQELNLNSIEYIYLYGKLIENVMIELQFYWENKGKEYTLKIGKKQKFHDVIAQLLTTNIDLQNYIITNIYYFPEDENKNKNKSTTKNINNDENENEKKEKNEIDIYTKIKNKESINNKNEIIILSKEKTKKTNNNSIKIF